jgi:thiol-disulfide isomerase/thioredoxin
MKRSWPLFLLIGILFAGFGAYLSYTRFKPATPEASAANALFSQQLADVTGKQVPLAQYKGKPLVVNFWATWCPPCVDEMPELNALQQELGVEKVRIVGIGIDSPSNIADFAEKQKISYPLLVAGMGGTELSRQLGNKAGGLPFTVMFDAQGKVRKQYLGRLKMDDLRRDLQALQAP